MIRAFLIASSVCLLLLSSCRTCKPQTVEVIRENTRVDSIEALCSRFDSVMIHDSIYIEKRGDTVLIDRTHFRTRVKLKTDTLVRYVEVRKMDDKKIVKAPDGASRASPFLWLIPVAAAIAAVVYFKRK